MAIVIQLKTREDLLERVVAQTRGLLGQLRQHAAMQQDLDRAQKRRLHRHLVQRLDPRRRLTDLWRGQSANLPPVSLSTWRKWMAQTILTESIRVVIAKPKPPPSEDKAKTPAPR
jgi:hypothetical protein